MAAVRESETTNVIHVDFARRSRDEAAHAAESALRPPPASLPPATPPPATLKAPEPSARTGPDEPTLDLYTRAEVSRLFGLPESRLRYWEKTGFISPSGRAPQADPAEDASERRFYTFQDLIGLRAAKSLIEQGTPLQRVRRSIESLQKALPHVIRPLAELRISSEGDRVLVQTDRAKWEPTSGQLVLDFDVRDLREEVVRVLRPDRHDPERRRAAYEAYLEGARLDDDPSTFERAEACYRRAVELDPSFGHALTNLGNVRFRRGHVDEAVTLYERALGVDPSQPEAHYNLGFIASERGEHARAVRSFEAAIEGDPAFADAHFNLASTLELLGQAKDARLHWESYLELAPDGSFADIARERLRRRR